MEKYHKIQTVWFRNPKTKYKTLLNSCWARPEFEYLKDAQWVFTEKVDGTNIRVYWDHVAKHVTLAGRTDRAQIPSFLLTKLQELFPVDLFVETYPETSMCLYGEGYGAKIQKGGGNYIPGGVSFILFDVMVNNCWLERDDVNIMANRLRINSVPIVGIGTLLQAIEVVRNGYISRLRNTPPEGLVLRPETELCNRRGERIITKIKLKDFAKEKQ